MTIDWSKVRWCGDHGTDDNGVWCPMFRPYIPGPNSVRELSDFHAGLMQAGCLACGAQDAKWDAHTLIPYRDGGHMHPLCSRCWDASTPLHRSWFAARLLACWVAEMGSNADEYFAKWPAIKAWCLASKSRSEL